MLAHVYGMQLLMSICFLKMLLVTSSSIYDYYDFSAGIDSETFPVCAEVTLTQGKHFNVSPNWNFYVKLHLLFRYINLV